MLVRPYLLGTALAHALDGDDRDVIAIDCDHGDVPPERYSVIVTTERIPSGVEAEAIIELPPANSRSFGAVHHGSTTRLLVFDDPAAVNNVIAELSAAV